MGTDDPKKSPKCPRCWNVMSQYGWVMRCPCCGFQDHDHDRDQAQKGSRDTIICGLDLGKTVNHSAFTAWKRSLDQESKQWRYDCQVIHRWPLGTSYHEKIVPQTIQFMSSPRLSSAYLAVDYGQVGVALLELFETPGLAGRVEPISITGGNSWKRDDETLRWSVSKIELCSLVQKLLSSGRIKVDRSLLSEASKALIPALESELLNFREKHNTKTGNTSYSGKDGQGQQDDIAMATAIAMFIGEHGGFGPCDDTPNDEARGLVSRMPRDAWGQQPVEPDNPNIQWGR